MERQLHFALAVGGLCFALSFLGSAAAAPPPAQQMARASRNLLAQLPIIAVRDIALQERNTLHGQVVDSEGMALANYEVWIAREEGSILKTRTDAAGRFVVPELEAGTYRIDTAAGGGKFRFWEAKKAPANVPSNVLLVVHSRPAAG
jgi:hypothetical protein